MHWAKRYNLPSLPRIKQRPARKLHCDHCVLQLAAVRAEAQRWRDLAADRDAVVAERDALKVRKHSAGIGLQCGLSCKDIHHRQLHSTAQQLRLHAAAGSSSSDSQQWCYHGA